MVPKMAAVGALLLALVVTLWAPGAGACLGSWSESGCGAGCPAIVPKAPYCSETVTGQNIASVLTAPADQVVVMTGGDSGLGYTTAEALAQAGSTLVIGSLRTADGNAAAAAIKAATKSSKVEILPLDLSSLASVRAFAASVAKAHPHVNVLINCAGIVQNITGLPALTVDGFERVFQVNYLGHHLLSELLLPALRPVAGRVLNPPRDSRAEPLFRV